MTVTERLTTGLDQTSVQKLRTQFHGELLLPGEAGYDAARTVWNAMIDRRPALIARCSCAVDIMAGVTFARETGLLLSIKGGGHNVAGRAVCEGGVLLDLSPMKGIQIDRKQRLVRAEPGVLWEELDRATQAHDLATVGGVVGSTGIAGLTLGGGQGWLTGKYGLSLDNLLAVDVVTADGTLRRASVDEDPELFWAMRGAGTNFGVVSSFTFRLHPVSTVLGGLVIHPVDRARDVLRFYREFALTQPDELTTYAAVLTAPDGNPVVAMVACYNGDLAEGENVLAPLRGFGRPVADTVGPIGYLEMQGIIGPSFPHGRRNYWKSGMTAAIADEVIDAVSDAGQRLQSPQSAIVVADCHGAYARVGNRDTAYAQRHLQFDLVILSSWVDAAATDANVRWTRELYAAVEPHLGDGVYINDLDGDDGHDRVRRAFGENYDRLATLKHQIDPDNLFRQNTNIPPTRLAN
jgi:FAD/FMN-containing dehydrogenase